MSPSPAPARVKLKDVALKAGVATGTVSMVLNDSPLVATATKAQVLKIIQEMGYVYNRAAGNLRSKSSRIVGVSICDLMNPYFAEVLAGIQEVVDAKGRVPVLGNCAESVERQAKFLDTLREYEVDGILLTPVIGTPRCQVLNLEKWGTPVVQVTRYVHGAETDYVGNNNRLALGLAVRHLVQLGHKHIAYLAHNPKTPTGQDRYTGFKEAMEEAGLAMPKRWTHECMATREDGFSGAVRLLSQAKPPTAMVCFSDVVAFGAMLGIRSIGKEAGRDCAVVGLDDLMESRLWQPRLTSVAVDRQRIGHEAVRLLYDRIRTPNKAIEHIALEPELVVRDSCGSPRVS
ncbi:LacI family transcriptional regulator [Variovorax boronicumulans]|uniref:LacI family DNA-binding transcriptional regulator n=1 Tax=Variovorax boronicumulans TaxID=436515 RepID=UPI00277FB95D|nr:LacI family DNA-binding transcriptional regulator [Variovorax boronicumulans]MDP9912257.1 LacI family transcriptional regulator [Variovorax boronicumulans]